MSHATSFALLPIDRLHSTSSRDRESEGEILAPNAEANGIKREKERRINSAGSYSIDWSSVTRADWTGKKITVNRKGRRWRAINRAASAKSSLLRTGYVRARARARVCVRTYAYACVCVCVCVCVRARTRSAGGLLEGSMLAFETRDDAWDVIISVKVKPEIGKIARLTNDFIERLDLLAERAWK